MQFWVYKIVFRGANPVRNQQFSSYSIQYFLVCNQKHMEKQNAQPLPTPTLTSIDQPTMPTLMQHLSLNDKSSSIAGTEGQNEKKNEGYEKNKKIFKDSTLKRSYKRHKHPNIKQNYKKKVTKLEAKVQELETELDRLRKKMQCCVQCRYWTHKKQQSAPFQFLRPNYEEEMKKVAGSLNDSRGSMGSVEFQNVDFHAPMTLSKQMDDKAWVYLGTLMIAMGSKNLQVDGTINVFRVLKESVDTLRRQVQKSNKNISMDFYLTQEQMKEINFMQDIGFDPFTQKISGEMGLALEGVKVESVQQFQLIYDNKLTYNIKYEALLGAMEYLKQNSWVTF